MEEIESIPEQSNNTSNTYTKKIYDSDVTSECKDSNKYREQFFIRMQKSQLDMEKFKDRNC